MRYAPQSSACNGAVSEAVDGMIVEPTKPSAPRAHTCLVVQPVRPSEERHVIRPQQHIVVVQQLVRPGQPAELCLELRAHC